MSRNVLYFDCFSGASGDMILGALIDLGVPVELVRENLSRLRLDGWELDAEEVDKAGLRATKVSVRADEEGAPSRRLPDITLLLEGSDLPEPVRKRALRTFGLLAEAEGRVHGKPADEVHFHEVGALDAIVDIVGASIALEHLDPALVVTSPISTGRGFVNSAHGRFPLPGPAVTELLRGAQIVEEGSDELITPTGAAILAAASHRFGPLPAMRLTAAGYGAGSRDRAAPNVLRVLLGTLDEEETRGDSLLLETNIDDMSPEIVPYAIDRALAAGASDAWVTPILMKKGRPAITLSVLTKRAHLDEVLAVIYRETTTLGVRIREVLKDELDRTHSTIEVAGHPLRMKVGHHGGRVVTVSPEYEDARKIAQITGVPLKDIYREALARFSTEDES